jgi:hypothetical protein
MRETVCDAGIFMLICLFTGMIAFLFITGGSLFLVGFVIFGLMRLVLWLMGKLPQRRK